MRLLNDRILVKIDPTPDKSKGGIIIPSEVQQNTVPDTGTVVLCGPGLRNPSTYTLAPLQVNPQDQITFSRYGLIKVENSWVEGAEEGFEYGVIKESDIILVK